MKLNSFFLFHVIISLYFSISGCKTFSPISSKSVENTLFINNTFGYQVTLPGKSWSLNREEEKYYRAEHRQYGIFVFYVEPTSQENTTSEQCFHQKQAELTEIGLNEKIILQTQKNGAEGQAYYWYYHNRDDLNWISEDLANNITSKVLWAFWSNQDYCYQLKYTSSSANLDLFQLGLQMIQSFEWNKHSKQWLNDEITAGMLALSEGKFVQAKEKFLTLTEMYPDSAALKWSYASAAYYDNSVSDKEAGIKAYTEAIDLNSHRPELDDEQVKLALKTVASFYLEPNRPFHDAYPYLKKWSELFGDEADPWYHLAQYYVKIQEFKTGLENLTIAIRRNPELKFQASTDPAFKPLQELAEFKILLEK